ncbi:MAG: hypothetical protein WCJ66_00360 [Verrucomicrobiota bacterium]
MNFIFIGAKMAGRPTPDKPSDCNIEKLQNPNPEIFLNAAFWSLMHGPMRLCMLRSGGDVVVNPHESSETTYGYFADPVA